MSVLLGVNIDHAATVRAARVTAYPDIANIAREALAGGADFITVHLREDRRHIQDDDLPRLLAVDENLNLEMAAVGEMREKALKLKPRRVCLVPERREELTTEGGLNAHALEKTLREFCAPLIKEGVEVSLFVNAEDSQIQAAAQTGARAVELHTGVYAEDGDIAPLRTAAEQAAGLGLKVNAGHGLHYENTAAVAALPHISELNIGHAIVARALFAGMRVAVAEMVAVIDSPTPDPSRREGRIKK